LDRLLRKITLSTESVDQEPDFFIEEIFPRCG
jgi:hypothetical protein